jgi:predicted regulator of Ras-like GTPase activity (Roadblock/LC7/MglB family)
LPGFSGEHLVEFSCEEIFSGLTPKLSLSRLAEIASEHVKIDGLPDQSIRLPVARLAVAFRFINGRELIEEPPPPATSKPKRSPEEFAPKAAGAGSQGDGGEASPAPDDRSAPADEKKPSIATAISADSPETGLSPASADDKSLPVEEKVSGAAPGTPEETGSEQPKSEEPDPWRPIPVFPVLRRKATEPQVKPPVAPLRPIIEPRPPSGSPEEPDAKGEPTQGLAKERVTPPVQAEAVLVDAEPKRTVEIVDHDALQAVFMTEETLSVDRVVELCGGLPGIKSCVLAHGAAVIASHNVPESFDLVSLSAHALEMLATMRQSAARMGVGAVPAVTIHAEKGPITFFHQDDLCLLVMHKDRGFVPGVREKLQNVVERLAQTCPELPGETTRPIGGPRKPAG